MATLICGGTEIAGVDAIIFDKDGTLADSRPYLWELTRRRARCLEEKLPGSFEPLLAAFGCSGAAINPEGLMAVGSRQENLVVAAGFLAQTGCSWVDAMAIAEAAFQAASPEVNGKAHQTPPYPGTGAMLARLAASSVALGILSSDSPGGVEEFVETYRLGPYLTDWLGTQAADPPKPNPALMGKLCQRLGADPRRAVVVGDTRVDQEMARQAGARAFLSVSNAWGSQAVDGADAVIQTWDDLEIITPFTL